MQDKETTSAVRRRELHDLLTAEAGAMFTALDDQLDAGGVGDVLAAAVAERRYVRSQLVLAHDCGTLSAYYREGSTTHLALSLAAAALGWAAWRHPELVGELEPELRAARAAAGAVPLDSALAPYAETTAARRAARNAEVPA